MGLLEELIILVKDSIDEANQRGKRKPAAPVPDEHTEEEIQTLRRTLAHRAAQARAEQERQREEEAAHAEQERQRQAQERERQRQKQIKMVQATQVVQQTGAVDPRRIARLVRHPNAVREMIVLREILDKPLALRRR